MHSIFPALRTSYIGLSSLGISMYEMLFVLNIFKVSVGMSLQRGYLSSLYMTHTTLQTLIFYTCSASRMGFHSETHAL